MQFKNDSTCLRSAQCVDRMVAGGISLILQYFTNKISYPITTYLQQLSCKSVPTMQTNTIVMTESLVLILCNTNIWIDPFHQTDKQSIDRRSLSATLLPLNIIFCLTVTMPAWLLHELTITLFYYSLFSFLSAW